MPSDDALDLEKIRRLVVERVDHTSQRAVAAEIGLSKSGLQAFLKGHDPYATTRQKLAEWYLRSRSRPGVTPAELREAVAVIRRFIDVGGPKAARPERIADVRALLFEE